MIQTPFYRIYQFTLKLAAYFLGIHEPKTINEVDAILKAGDILIERGYKHPLVVTDKGLYSLLMHEKLVKSIKDKGLGCSLYFDVVANPTIKNVNDGLEIFKNEGCDSIIAIGGGSAMDCAKTIGALAVNPKKNVEDLKGILHVHRNIPFFIAIPTTAGTGSETTLAAVIVNEKTHFKYAVNDPHLIPKVAILDPTLLQGLPPHITSTTGMDALTHAVEAFIGRSNTKKTKKSAIDAIKLISENLIKV